MWSHRPRRKTLQNLPRSPVIQNRCPPPGNRHQATRSRRITPPVRFCRQNTAGTPVSTPGPAPAPPPADSRPRLAHKSPLAPVKRGRGVGGEGATLPTERQRHPTHRNAQNCATDAAGRSAEHPHPRTPVRGSPDGPLTTVPKRLNSYSYSVRPGGRYSYSYSKNATHHRPSRFPSRLRGFA